MFRSRTRLIAILCASLVFPGGLVTPVLAESGGSQAAEQCRHGGSRDLTDADGTPFRNTGECVRYMVRSVATLTVSDNVIRDFGYGPINDFYLSGSGFLWNTRITVSFVTDTGVMYIGPDPYTTDSSGHFSNPFSWDCAGDYGTVNSITVTDGTRTAYATQDILC